MNEINSNLLTKLKKEDNSENFNTIETIVNCRLLQTQSSEFNKSTANRGVTTSTDVDFFDFD